MSVTEATSDLTVEEQALLDVTQEIADEQSKVTKSSESMNHQTSLLVVEETNSLQRRLIRKNLQ